MPASDSPALIVARFLKSSNYDQSYEAFVSEAGLPPDAGTVSKGDLTLETLLEEKKAFDLSVRFEKLGVDGNEGGDGKGWREPAPHKSEVVNLPALGTNILCILVAEVVKGTGEGFGERLFVSTADRRVHMFDAETRQVQETISGEFDAPVLSMAVVRRKWLFVATMSGQLLFRDLGGRSESRWEKRRDHAKYVVKIAVWENHHEDDGTVLLATAGWDCKVVLYRLTPRAVEAKEGTEDDGSVKLAELVATITLPTKPEAICFIRHPEESQVPILLLSRTDSSFLYYYSTDSEPRLLGRQNLTPYNNAWVAFTPSALELCPTDPTLLAVGTSSVPHMKLLIVRLLVPSDGTSAAVSSTVSSFSASALQQPQQGRGFLLDENSSTAESPAAQARAAFAMAEREASAIQIHCNTMAPQTPYSTPAVVWRPDGSGVFVNGDDGAVRGVEVRTGKVVTTLKGHQTGSKVRCLWSGKVAAEEVMVSGGFDHRVVVWRAGD